MLMPFLEKKLMLKWSNISSTMVLKSMQSLMLETRHLFLHQGKFHKPGGLL